MFSYPHRHIHELVKDTNKKALLRAESQRTIEVYNKFSAAEVQRARGKCRTS